MRPLYLAILVFVASLLPGGASAATMIPSLTFRVSIQGGADLPVEWVYGDVRRTLTDGSEYELSWSEDAKTAQWDSVPFGRREFVRGVGFLAFQKDLVSVNLLDWANNIGGTVRVGYRRSLFAYVGKKFVDFRVISTDNGYEVYQDGRKVRAIRVNVDFSFLHTPGIASIEAVLE